MHTGSISNRDQFSQADRVLSLKLTRVFYQDVGLFAALRPQMILFSIQFGYSAILIEHISEIFFSQELKKSYINLTAAMRGVIIDRSVLYRDVHRRIRLILLLWSRTPLGKSFCRFRGDGGTHKNTIEGFWAHMKIFMRKEHGTNRSHIYGQLIQYTLKDVM